MDPLPAHRARYVDGECDTTSESCAFEEGVVKNL